MVKNNEFKHMSDERFTFKPASVNMPKYYDSEQKVNELETLVFAPDPDTLLPRSDFAVMLSRSQNDELSSYIRDNLMRPVSLPSGIDDADVAMEMIRGRGERLENYANRLRDIVTSKR